MVSAYGSPVVTLQVEGEPPYNVPVNFAGSTPYAAYAYPRLQDTFPDVSITIAADGAAQPLRTVSTGTLQFASA